MVLVLVFIAVCVPFNACSERWCVDTVFWARIALIPLWSWCSCVHLPDVGMRIRLMGMISLVSPWSWCSCGHCQTLVFGYGLWAWIAWSLRGPSARVFSAMEIPLLQYFPGGRCPCSVLSRSDRGDSTGTVLRSVDDVPVVVQRQVQGQTVQKACWYRSCVRGRFPSWRRGRFHGPNCRLTMDIPSCSTRWPMLLLCRRHEARSYVLVGPCAQAHGQG